MKTVSQLAKELGVSKSTLFRTIQRNDFETIQQGNKWLIDETIEQAIIQALQEKTLQAETICNDSETTQKRCRNASRNDIDTILIDELRAQIAELKADKAYLQERLTAAEQERAELKAERDSLTKERQTILAQMLELREPKVIEIKEAAANAESRPTSEPEPAPKRSRPQTQPPSLLDYLKARFRRKR